MMLPHLERWHGPLLPMLLLAVALVVDKSTALVPSTVASAKALISTAKGRKVTWDRVELGLRQVGEHWWSATCQVALMLWP